MKKTLKKAIASVGAFSVGDFSNLINPKKGGVADPKVMIVNIINYSLFFIGVVALVFVVWGGIQFMTSGGDAEKVTKARNTMLYAILGIIVVVLAYAIVNWVGNNAGSEITMLIK